MKKEAILEKSKEENQYADERERQEMRNSFGFGGIIICILCVLFSVIHVLRGEGFYEFCAIIFGYLAGISWYNYKIMKRPSLFVFALACTFVGIVGFICFLLLG